MSSRVDLVELGIISRPHGYRGHLVVHSHGGKSSALGYIKHLYLSDSNESYEVLEASWMPSGWKIHLKGFTSDAQVNLLRGKKVFAERSKLSELNQNEFYVSQLEGMQVQRVDTRETVGIFRGVEVGDNGCEWWRIEGQDRLWLVPPKKHFIEKVDIEAKLILVNHWDELP